MEAIVAWPLRQFRIGILHLINHASGQLMEKPVL